MIIWMAKYLCLLSDCEELIGSYSQEMNGG